MNMEDFKPCPHCNNQGSKCLTCHFTGWVNKETGEPADKLMGRTPRYEKHLKREEEKNKPKRKRRW